MMEVGPHGVDCRLIHAVRTLARRIQHGDLTRAEALAEVTRLKQNTPHHPPLLVAFAVGIACAAFGSLLGLDWAAFIPVFTAGAIGQSIRHALLRRDTNVFIVTAGVAFLASSLGELGAKLAGSTTVSLAMIASCLLLVPGVPALNAQSDIMEGHPTLGTARAVSVLMLLMFIAVGVMLARAVLAVRP
jgi:uncharacterized membrane protein YjjP (DUF1212 family)